MNLIDFNQVGGFPLSTKALDDLQKAFSVFNALGAIAGDKTIISGCQTVGTNVSNGFVYAYNEVFEFRGGTAQTKVKIVEVVEDLVFEDNVSRPVIKTRYITFGTGIGSMDWADFKRGLPTKNLEATFTGIANSLATIIDKLDTIDRDAKVQVPTDWNATTGPGVLLNKPGIINYLHKGVATLDDLLTNDGIQTVSFPDVGTNNYMVVGSMVSTGSNYNLDNDIIWMVREKANSSFKIVLREVNGAIQSLDFEYMLIPL